MTDGWKRGMHREPKWPLMGYAPGKYMGRCAACGEQVIDVDKRATQCLPCAIEAAEKALLVGMGEARLLREQNAALRDAIQIVSTPSPFTEGGRND